MTKTELEEKIIPLIKLYAPKGTTFRWSNSTKNFGSCSYKINRYGKVISNFTISISWPIAAINSWKDIEDTVYHEIAHAVTPGHNHDEVWRAVCVALGGNGKRYFMSTANGGKVNVPYKWEGTCPKCGNKFYRNRRVNGYCCDRSKYITWKPYNVNAPISIVKEYK